MQGELQQPTLWVWKHFIEIIYLDLLWFTFMLGFKYNYLYVSLQQD